MNVSYRVKIMTSILALTTVIVGVTSYLDYQNVRNASINEETQNRSQTEIYALDSVQSVDKAYDIFDKQLGQQMESASNSLLTYYQNHHTVSRWNYADLKTQYGFDIYLINRDYVITNASLNTDIGLDFKKVAPDFANALKQIFENGKFNTEGMGIEDLTGKAKKYSYMPTPDGKYIIELGYDIQGSLLFSNFNFTNVQKQIQSRNPSIVNVHLYLNKRILGESNKKGNAILLNKKYEAIYNEVLSKKKTIDVTEKVGNDIQVHRFIFYAYKENMGGTNKVVEITFSNKYLQNVLTNQTHQFIVKLILSLLASFVISYFISTMINHVLRKMMTLIQKTTSFDLSEDENRIYTKDEFGKMEKLIHNMRKELKQIATEIHHSSDLLIQNAENVSTLTKELKKESLSTATSSSQLYTTTEEVSESSKLIEKNAQNVNDLIEKTGDKIVYASNTSKKTNERANIWKENSILSKETALELYQSVKIDIESAIQKVESVEQINEMAKSISNIAEQTNLLSLNASIEAARAGEQGRGFMVVADEVKKLAKSTSDTAKDIQSVTSSIKSNVQELSERVIAVLNFIEDKVLKDYESVVKDTEEYEKDIKVFTDLLDDFSLTFQKVRDEMNQTTFSLSQMSDSFEETAESIKGIAISTEKVANMNEKVENQTNSNIELSNTLRSLINRFKF